MKPTLTRFIVCAAAWSLAAPMASAQFPARFFLAGGGGRSTLVKPGFDFDPGAFGSLSGYTVVSDELDDDLTPAGTLVRRVGLEDAYFRLSVTLGVSQTGASGIAPLFANYVAESEMSPALRLVHGATVGIMFGDERQVGRGSTPGAINREFAFRRANIFVSVYAIEIATGGSVNLLAIGSELDSAVAALPDITQATFDALVPVITTFSAVPTTLTAYQAADLTLTATDPSSLPLTAIYGSPQGDVVFGVPDKYVAGSAVGVQTLTVVVSNPRLMFATASINFTVTP